MNAFVFAKLLIFHFGKVEDIIILKSAFIDYNEEWMLETVNVGDNFSDVGDRFFKVKKSPTSVVLKVIKFCRIENI